MVKLVEPNQRFINHYYYDENSKSWFYIIRILPDSNMWVMDYVKHTVSGWKRIYNHRYFSIALDPRRFANKPFVVDEKDLKTTVRRETEKK